MSTSPVVEESSARGLGTPAIRVYAGDAANAGGSTTAKPAARNLPTKSA